MNEIFATLVDTTSGLTQYAFNLLLQSTALIVVGLMIGWAMRRYGSAVQSAIYRATLVTVLVCPIAAISLNLLGFQGWTVQILSTQQMVTNVVSDSAPELSPPVERKQVDHELEASLALIGNLASAPKEAAGQVFQNSEVQAERLQTPAPITTEVIRPLDPVFETTTVNSPITIATYYVVSLLWIIGVLLFLSRVLLAYRRLGALRQQSSFADEPERQVCEHMAQRINVCSPEIRRNALLSSPCLTGITAPAILLPTEINDRILLEKAFAHELGHLRRRDTLWNLIQRIALSFLFFQPLLWRLVYRLETTAEEVCDDYVVRHCEDRTGYAQQLVQLAESNLLAPNMAGLGMFKANGSMLGHRVVRILDSTRTLTTQISGPIVVSIISLAVVCATLGGFIGNGGRNDTGVAAFGEIENEGAIVKQSVEKTADESANETVTFTGSVVDSKGKPVAGATIYRNKYETTSGVDGSFKLEMPKSEELKFLGLPMLFAAKDGYGLAFGALEASISANSIDFMSSGDLQLILTEDSHPIAGNLVDPQGRPVAGATIEIKYIEAHHRIDEYLQAAARDQATIRDLPRGTTFVDERFKQVRSDSNGVFSIKGIGAGRAVHLKIFGEDIAVTKPIVVTAKSEPLAVFREAGMFGDEFGKVMIHGHQPTIVCEPTQVITGVVVDRQTGKPMAGVDIYSDRFSDVPIGGIRDLQTTTDKNGRFRLSGMPIGPNNEISVFPPTDGEKAIPYLARDVAVPAAKGLEPVDLRIQLQRGTWVRGKVVNKKTGQPIAAARVTYKPYNDNELAQELYSESRIPDPIGFRETKEDGLFQFVALPGKALLDIWVVRAPYFPPGQGWKDISDERKDHLGNILAQGYPCNQQHPTAMREIDVVDQESIDDLVFELDPGKSILVKLQDTEGKPLTGVNVENASSNINQDFHAKNESEFLATGFLEGQRRTMTFYHEGKNLGKIQTIGDGDESPVVVTLQPNARITGKLVDSDGDPLPRANIRFDLKENRNFFIKESPFKYVTNEDGVFDQIAIPGEYKVQVETMDDFYSLDLGLKIDPGDQIDMGTIDIAAISKKILDERKKRRNKKTPPKESVPENSNQEPAAAKGEESDTSSNPIAGDVVPDYQILLDLDADGKVKIGGQEVEEIKLLEPILKREIENAARQGVKNPGDISVVIRAPEETRTGLVQELLAKCQSSKLDKFLLRVKEKTNADQAEGDSVTFKGTVVDLNGIAVANAEVSRLGIKARTDAAGEFSISIAKSEVEKFADGRPYFVIRKDGYGNSVGRIDASQNQQQLTLVNDDHPIEGLLIDLEGNPVVGATVQVTQMSHFEHGFLEKKLSEALLAGSMKGLTWGLGLVPAKKKLATTDQDGHFLLRGIGSGRIAKLTITGDDIAIRRAVVATSDLGGVRYKTPRKNELTDGIIHNRKPIVICEPTQPIEGVIVDRETKAPIAGITVSSYGFLNGGPSRLGGQTDLKTTTDSAGRFRLPGMPKGKGNQILISTPRESKLARPYLPVIENVPGASGIDPVRMEIALQKGVWISGSVSDAQTNEPLSTDTVINLVEGKGNEAADKLDSTTQLLVFPPWSQDNRTNKDGEFRIVGVSGPTVVGVRTLGNNIYPKGQGSEKISDDAIERGGPFSRIFGRDKTQRLDFFTAVQLVDVDGDGVSGLKFRLSRGPLKIKTLAPDGKPIDGVQVMFTPTNNSIAITSTDAEFTLNGFLPGKQRQVIFRHQEKQLGVMAKIGPDGNEPVTVTLQPFGKITAKTVDQAGQPVAQSPVYYELQAQHEQEKALRIRARFQMPHKSMRSDDNGIISESVMPGSYVVSIGSFHGETGYRTVTVKPGQTTDLGAIDVTRMAKPKKLMAPQPRPGGDFQKNQASTPVSPQRQPTAADKVIRGIVKNSVGQPVPNANIRLNSWRWDPDYQPTTLAETKSDANGVFALKLEQRKFTRLNPTEQNKVHSALVVRAEGFGGSQTNWSEFSGVVPLTISLVPEQKVSGRVVDLEGKPVVGASVSFSSARKLGKPIADSFLESLRKTGSRRKAQDVFDPQATSYINFVSGAIEPMVKTNERGEFEFVGIPRDSLVTFKIEHRQIATQMISLLARSMSTFDADPDYKIFGDRPVVVTQPSRPIVGTVVDAASGKPIHGATVFCTKTGNSDGVFGTTVTPRVETAEDGSFELLGLPKSANARFLVYPPKNQPYLIKEVDGVPDTVGFEPAEMKLVLHRGIWITGQVTDKQAGAGVKAEIIYLPMRDNQHLKDVRGFQVGTSLNRYNYLRHFNTDDQGRFRIAGLPGRAVLGAQVYSEDYRSAHGYEKLVSEFGTAYSEDSIEKARAFGRDLTGKKFLDTHFSFAQWRNGLGSTFVGIEIPSKIEESVQNMQMDPGHEMKISVTTTAGNPVDRFEISRFDGGSGKREFTRGIGTLTKMGDDEKRRIWIRGTERPIGAVVEVFGAYRSSTSPSEFRTVALEPFGKIHGRLIDNNGKPVADLTVDASYGGAAFTNHNGEFEIDEVFARQNISLEIIGPAGRPSKRRTYPTNKKSQPGKTLELGDINVDELESYFIGGLGG